MKIRNKIKNKNLNFYQLPKKHKKLDLIEKKNKLVKIWQMGSTI